MASFTLEAPREYVRQQLQSLGIEDISEADLESYTSDFMKLIHEHLKNDSAVNSESSSNEGSHLQMSSSATTPTMAPPSGNTSHPVSRHSVAKATPQCAVYKTFPGDKENHVHFVPTGATPNPISSCSAQHCLPRGKVSSLSMSSSCDQSESRRRHTRKVLRRRNGEVHLDTTPSDQSSGIEPTRALSAPLSDEALKEKHCCRSFIRPLTTHPHLRGIRKCDPVNRYHEFRQMWEMYRAPEEQPRNKLRWHIREQLLQQDAPPFLPSKQPYQSNDFVVPTDKKRSALQWEIRHQH
ncbi:hypothetical protein EMCRGX_G032101 [Ephydatia muelleri]